MQFDVSGLNETWSGESRGLVRAARNIVKDERDMNYESVAVREKLINKIAKQ